MSVPNKNSNWLGWRIYDVLSPQTNKIKDVVYHQGLSNGGWEGWAQFELGYGLDKYMKALAEEKSVGGDECLYELAREEKYPETDQRWDFYMYGSLTTAMQQQHWDQFPNSTQQDPRSRSEVYYFELKCQGGSESMDGFVYRVDKDIDKIRDLDPRKLKGRGGTHMAVWMIAVTTSHRREDEDWKMDQLGTKRNVTWNVIPLTGVGFSKIWACCLKIKGNVEDSLFAYST